MLTGVGHHHLMADNVYKFRRIKWGAPKKLKVLVEDLAPRRRPLLFIALVCTVSVAAFAAVYFA